MAPKRDDLSEAKRLMSALARMPPKPHGEMKIGKPKGKPNKTSTQRRAVKKSAR